MKHTNIISFDLIPNWKNLTQRIFTFQSNNTRWLLCSMVFLMSSIANISYAKDANERLDRETENTISKARENTYGMVENRMTPIITCVDTTILCNTSTDPEVMGGQPTTVESGITFTHIDVVERFSSCLPGTGTDPDTISRITRTWQATDASGNSSTCTQLIHVVKPQLVFDKMVWPADTLLYCNDHYSPQLRYNGNLISINQFCLFGLSYQDQPITSSCIGTREVLRTWFIFDLCRPLTAPVTNAFVPGPQQVQFTDTLGPIISNLPTIIEIEVNSHNLNALATITVPPVVVTDACSPTSRIDVKVQLGNNTINTNGGTFTNVPFGTQNVIYTATDDCGNSTQSTVKVQYNIPIPNMSQWGLFIFGLLIMNLSVFFVTRTEWIKSK